LGSALHAGFSQAVAAERLEDVAAMAGMETVVIDTDAKPRRVQQELGWNDAAYGLKGGLVS